MEIQFIFNEADVKALAPISENTAGAYMSAAMFEAQEIGLKSILGASLLRAMKEKEKEGSISGKYAELKEMCIPYLVYRTIVALIPKVQYKIANAGAYTSTDERKATLGKEGTDALIADYQSQADFFCHELQMWICNNEASLPEIDACHCAEIRSNLYSAASCGLYLGGPRGKILPKGGCCK